MARAIRHDWPMDEDARRKVVARLLGIVTDDQRADLACKAASALIAADNVNAKREAGDVAARGQDVAAQRDMMDHLARVLPADVFAQLLDATLTMPAQPDQPQALPPPADRNGKPG
jgi:hypothetical protein